MGIPTILIIFLFAAAATGEYCPAYYDFNHVLQPGFYCPAGVRLVGISDYYCCQNKRLSIAIFCCNDRTKSVNYSHWSYGEELIVVNWPILLLIGMVIGILAIISFTAPRIAEMKDNIYIFLWGFYSSGWCMWLVYES